MANGDFQDRLRKDRQKFFDAGIDIGMQRMWDYVQIALTKKEVMSTHVLPKERLAKVFLDVQKSAAYFETAFTDHKEADVRQEELDWAIRQIWGDDTDSFKERYPYIKQQNYNKGKEKWR